MHQLTIGQVAKQLMISRDAIRIYEREGLIEVPERTKSGYRTYGEEALARLHFIQRAKAMGFTLKEIGELLAIKLTTSKPCEQVRAEAKNKLQQVEIKISELMQFRKALQTLIRTCSRKKNDDHCPILDALEQQNRRRRQK